MGDGMNRPLTWRESVKAFLLQMRRCRLFIFNTVYGSIVKSVRCCCCSWRFSDAPRTLERPNRTELMADEKKKNILSCSSCIWYEQPFIHFKRCASAKFFGPVLSPFNIWYVLMQSLTQGCYVPICWLNIYIWSYFSWAAWSKSWKPWFKTLKFISLNYWYWENVTPEIDRSDQQDVSLLWSCWDCKIILLVVVQWCWGVMLLLSPKQSLAERRHQSARITQTRQTSFVWPQVESLMY